MAHTCFVHRRLQRGAARRNPAFRTSASGQAAALAFPGEARARLRPGLRRLGFGCLLSGVVLALPATSAAQCTYSNNNTVTTCTGDLSAGVRINGPVELIVKDLAGNIVPPAGNAVSLVNNGGPPGAAGGLVTISYDGGGYEIISEGGGIYGGASGVDGASGQIGQDGGSGGGGMTLNFLSGSLTTSNGANSGLAAFSGGGHGGNSTLNSAGGNGGNGAVMAVNVTQGNFTQGSESIFAISAESVGGNGGIGGEQKEFGSAARGGAGGSGGSGGSVAVNLGAVTIDSSGDPAPAVFAQSWGGSGNTGGEGWSDVADGDGGAGGAGGNGGSVAITSDSASYPGTLQVATSQGSQPAIRAESLAGAGGTGGYGDAAGLSAGKGIGGDGGVGGSGGAVSVDLNAASIQTLGPQSLGVFARSYGGAGGNGGNGSGSSGRGGSGSGSGPGGAVKVIFSGILSTAGEESNGLFAQSVGGFSGGAGSSRGFVAYGAGSESAGGGGTVNLSTQGSTSTIKTTGDWASGLIGQSVGGGGGQGSAAIGLVALGGTGSAGGAGGAVTINNVAAVTTGGQGARAIAAGSHGGGGGAGGGAGGLVSVGGQSGSGGAGGQVQVSNSGGLTTSGPQADGIYSGSIGGGGGSAHSTGGLFAIGGSGGSGGGGGVASVQNIGSVSTGGADADAVFVHSVGGGGGDASNAIGVSAGFSLAIGGTGGGGGNGMAASYADGGADGYNIATAGERARGIFVQSVGGGGGDGGNAISASGSQAWDIAIGASGSAGPGGSGGNASASVAGGVSTADSNATAINVQSIGGGGGSAGTTVASANGSGLAVNVAVGGSGGAGGSGGQVDAAATSTVATKGDISHGIFAHSVGGGGGHSGVTAAGSAVSNLDLSAVVGGSGGNGGAGAGVTAASSGTLSTAGNHGYGINAASIGGGGGAAYFTGGFSGVSGGALSATIGGSGGSGGNASTVGVTAGGSIGTGGLMAPGIAAASIGGGGGDGGTVVTADTVSAFGNIGVTVGGGGGVAGTGATVTVDSSADIKTAGAHSEGIRAHSIGGGGGNSGTVVTASGVTQGNILVTVGGDGGKAAASGPVTVTNTGGVTTAGTFASAIDAKSIAGGGGNAKGSITASALSMGNLTATVGGTGGAGGTAGAVGVTSGAPVVTGGDFAYGIVAQSLGGGGGEGGYAVEASLTAGEVSGSVNAAIGGGGGAGSLASEVDVTTTAPGTIQTTGYGSHGVLAQSIGGSGGIGGNVYSGNLSFSSEGSAQVNLDLGGDGGTGATGGKVLIRNAANISTAGYLASGILAQSIGGGGGSGGNVYTVVGTVTPTSSVNIGAAVGGAGGAGQEAGSVEVDNQGRITTQKGGATAIYASSVGGGGGRGGNAANINLDLAGGGSGSKFNGALDIDVGGAGGSAGNGNTVTVNNAGALSTAGASAKGIFAQSVGGGGGDGGTASSTSFGLNTICKLYTGGNKYLCSKEDSPDDETEVTVSLTIAIGGKGGAAGDGEAVNVTNSAPITTTGKLGHAIAVHSIGGGGGVGGEGGLGIEAWTTNELLRALASLPDDFQTSFEDFTDIGIGVGGSGGASGTGGDVTVNNTRTLATSGDHAFGIHAQSIGGGGGNGGAGSTGLTTNITVGGAGSGGGAGGNVTVSTTGGWISTSGNGAIGIFAQSVGGGGGTAGDVEMGLTTEDLNIGAGVGVQQSPGAGGDGGAVTVTTSNIATTGAAAHGIFAQSVGGSGGVAGISGLFEAGAASYVGSAGDPGHGGAVSVNVSAGPVSVSGEGAHAIFAQSVSGGQIGFSSGDINIQTFFSLSANGQDGRAILAQSASADNQNNGDISIEIYSQSYRTTVETGPNGKETIYLLGGANNQITNYYRGTVTQNNPNSYVIRTDGIGKTTVTNYGTINGSVLGTATGAIAGVDASRLLADDNPSRAVFLAPSAIQVMNQPGGVFNAGQLLDVSQFSNQGTLSVGGSGLVGTTRMTGNLTQQGSGLLAVDLNPNPAGSDSPADRLHVDGRADLDGQIAINLLDVWQPNPGAQSVPILTADGGLSYAGLELTRSAVAQYQLQQPTPGALHVGYSVDFANPGILAQTNDNQDSIARHIHGIYRAQALDSAIARDLIAIEDSANYAQVMNTLSAEIAVDNQIGSLLSGIRFNDALLSCAERTGDYRFFDQGQCGWLRLRGQHFEQQQTNDNLGFDEDSWQLAGGGQVDVGNGWHLGGALSYEWRNLNADDSNTSSDGGQFQAGVSAKRRFGATELSGSLAIGYGDFDIDRNPWPGESINGTQKLWLYSAQVRAAHLIEYGRWSLKPRLDLGLDYLTMGGFNESGNNDFGIRIDGDNQTFVNLQPAIDIQTEFETDDGLLIRPKLTLGITQFLGNAAPSVTGRFSSAPEDVAPFTASTDLDKTRFDVAAGVEVFTSSNLVVRAELFGSFSDNTESYGGGLKVAMPF